MFWFASLQNPVGPDVETADTVELTLSGTLVQFKAPVHSARVVPFRSYGSEFNIYDESIYIPRSKKKKGFDFIIAYNAEWGVHGLPLIQRHIGKIYFGVSVVKTTKPGSFLQPSFAENLLAEDLDERMGPVSGMRRGKVSARKDWSTLSLGGHVWMSYLVEEEGNKVSKYYFLPLTDDHMLAVSVSCDTYHKKANTGPLFQQLCKKLIESFDVELSSDAMQQQLEAKKRWPDERYSEHLPAFHWEPEYEEDNNILTNPNILNKWYGEEEEL